MPHRLLRFIDRLGLGTPDAFRADPYGWAANGLSHVALGAGGAWLGARFGMAPPLVLGLAALIVFSVEALHLARGGDPLDSLADAGLVLGGALLVELQSLALFAGIVAVLVAGIVIRIREIPK